MFEFYTGEAKTALVPVTNLSQTAFDYVLYLYLGIGQAALASASVHVEAGQTENVPIGISMPSQAGTYSVFLDVYVSDVLVGHFQSTEDVMVSPGAVLGWVTDNWHPTNWPPWITWQGPNGASRNNYQGYPNYSSYVSLESIGQQAQMTDFNFTIDYDVIDEIIYRNAQQGSSPVYEIVAYLQQFAGSVSNDVPIYHYGTQLVGYSRYTLGNAYYSPEGYYAWGPGSHLTYYYGLTSPEGMTRFRQLFGGAGSRVIRFTAHDYDGPGPDMTSTLHALESAHVADIERVVVNEWAEEEEPGHYGYDTHVMLNVLDVDAFVNIIMATNAPWTDIGY